jgi:predicted Zn-dependent protease
VADTVSRAYRAHGVDAAIRTYRALHAAHPAAFDFGADQLDIVGHQLAERGQLPAAVAILTVNAEQFADSSWVLESLGETQALANDAASALETYRRALAKSPQSPSAREMVRRLERLYPPATR